jgi:putative glycosyltransferase
MKISIVTTTHESAPTVIEFLNRIDNAVKKLNSLYEIIVVDDGSTDDTIKIVKHAQKKNKNIKCVELSRNFGHHQAILFGLEKTSGDLVFLIDSDLEESPELILDFYSEIVDSNADVIFGVSEKLHGNILSKTLSFFFWRLFKYFTKIKIPKGISTVRIMKRQYVNALISHKEVNIFLAGLWAITGFNQKPKKILKSYKGSSHYSLRKKLDLALISFVAFSGKPLRAIAKFGFATVMLALVMLTGIVLKFFISDQKSQGWLSLLTVIILFGGLQILSIGLVAVYVASILEEVKARPRVIVRNIWPRD